ncbi:hypothetical protein C8A05DRAFT_40179, partial [Staphylotrichum tortipilum]
IVDTVIKAHLTLQNRTVKDEWLIVIDSPHDIILGYKWLEHHDVLVDCRRQRLLFPPEWEPYADWRKGLAVKLADEDNGPPDPKVMEDVRRRDALIDADDRRRRAGHGINAIRARIEELERQHQAQEKEAARAPVKERTILPRGTPLPDVAATISRLTAPCDKGIRQMERTLGNTSPTPPPSEPRRAQARPAEQPPTLDRPHHVAVISATAFRRMSRRGKGHAHAAATTGITTLHEIDR